MWRAQRHTPNLQRVPNQHRPIRSGMDTNLDQMIERGKRAFEHRDYITALANFQEVIERKRAR